MSCALLATGDVMLQKPILETAGPGLQQVLTALRSHDHVFINLEEALTERGERSDKLVCLRANPQLATEVARTGASVVTLANNHAFDFGPTGLRTPRTLSVRPRSRTWGLDQTSKPACGPPSSPPTIAALPSWAWPLPYPMAAPPAPFAPG